MDLVHELSFNNSTTLGRRGRGGGEDEGRGRRGGEDGGGERHGRGIICN